MTMIAFRAVSKHYPGRHVIDALSFEVAAGERIILFGPSGCGKSTVLQLIAGLVTPDSGDILINQELASTAGNNLLEPGQRGIGMVFQDLALWPHMTVAENIEFGLKAGRLPVHERRQRVRDLVHLVKLGDYLDARPGELSGGEQQRVALARALAPKPRILLMDEALANFDEALNRQMRREILCLHDELQFTLVYVTHSGEEARELGTRTITLAAIT
ncbi:MAG: ABC transporter ATP-binding protein [Burkholderiales bacterium]